MAILRKNINYLRAKQCSDTIYYIFTAHGYSRRQNDLINVIGSSDVIRSSDHVTMCNDYWLKSNLHFE